MISKIQSELRSAINNSVKPGYVYTYPPKRAFRNLNSRFSLEKAWEGSGSEVNIYIHIPFCSVRCKFCNLFTLPIPQSAGRDITDLFTDAMIQEIKNYEIIGRKKVKTIYWGGGTPTYLSKEQLGRILAQLKESFEITSEVENSIEVYPDDAMKPDLLEGLKSLGFNRVSFGIQTFDPDELDATGRGYPAELGSEVVKRVKDLGFDDVNVDLIYGLPRQTFDKWIKNVHIVGELLPSTVTLYSLMIRPKTNYNLLQEKGKEDFVDFETKFHWYEAGRKILKEYGYIQETTVRFVLPDKGGYQQQSSEFKGTPTIGLGPGARSSSPNFHYSTNYAVEYSPTKSIIENYITAVNNGHAAAQLGFELDKDEQMRRYVIQALQLPEGVDGALFESLYGVSIFDKFPDQLDALQLEECISHDNSLRIVLTEKGRKYSDICVGIFFSERVNELVRDYVHV
jgi:oxygen-independent coproporphyrinogen-3 oxidase